MTQDDIFRIAREANLWITSDERCEAVVRFAALVAAETFTTCGAEKNTQHLKQGNRNDSSQRD